MIRRLIVTLVWMAPILVLTGCGSPAQPLVGGHELKLLAAVDPQEISPGRYLVGWVMFTPPGSGSQVQTIAIEMDEPYIDWPELGIEQIDVNFDGSLDIGVHQYKGADWRRTYWWLYDTEKARFHTNSLTNELKDLIHSSFDVDPESRRIATTLLVGVDVVERTFKVVKNHLELVESSEP